MYGQGSGSSSRSGANDNNGNGDAGRRSAAELLAAREKEIDDMRRRLQKLEKLDREIQIPQVASQDEEPEAAIEAAAIAEKAEVDARSIYVGNVDYACLPEDVQQHFQFCGTINRVTILADSFGQPKGFAFVEFVEAEAVKNALRLNETELYGRPLKVLPKRTNIPGMKRSREWQPFHTFSPHYPDYGKASRFRLY